MAPGKIRQHMVEIKKGIVISEDELVFKFSRSSGPGGQNVNKVSTRVTLFFNIENSTALSHHQKRLIKTRLSTRISKDGVLRVVSQKFRTQPANKRAAIERFTELVSQALTGKPPRTKTPVPKSAKLKRLKNKKFRGEIKKLRKPVGQQ